MQNEGSPAATSGSPARDETEGASHAVRPLADPSFIANNSSMSTVPEDGDEMWADAPEAVETDDDASGVQQVAESDGHSSTTSVNPPSGLVSATNVDKLDVVDLPSKDSQTENSHQLPIDPPSSPPNRNETPDETEEIRMLIASSTRSTTMPISGAASLNEHVGSTLDVASSSSHTRPTSPAPTSRSASALDRRQTRRRSVLDGRSNRFSGFLSSLIHRRPERDISSDTQGRRPEVDDRETPPVPREGSSRASSPSPPTRPVTPPPPISAPTLQDLGLSMTAVTSILTPSHFSTPPTNGTFLKPHYLLLCHSQGLDVLPLVSPPSPLPYALVRRVTFKSVVVMEEKGVLVAIAGRRDGVRVYALEEVRKAIEWRVGVEIRREQEKQRREELKRGISGGVDKVFGDLKSPETTNPGKPKVADPPPAPTPAPNNTKTKLSRRATTSTSEPSKQSSPRPRAPTTGRRPKPGTSAKERRTGNSNSDPPPYHYSPTRPEPRAQPSVISVSQSRTRSGSVNNVLAGPVVRRCSVATVTPKDDEKGDWDHDSSDEEAINMATAGPSGSAALDERTSSMSPGNQPAANSPDGTQATTLDIPNLPESMRRTETSQTVTSAASRRHRPAQLDLSLNRTMTNTSATRPPPSPTPSIWTLRQALAANSASNNSRTNVSDNDDDDDDGEGEDFISFEQALAESRLPSLPPPGTTQPQEAIIITAESDQSILETQSPQEIIDTRSIGTGGSQSRRSRRRWSVFDGVFSHQSSASIDSVASANRSNTSIVVNRSVTHTSTLEVARPSTPLTRVTSADSRSIQRASVRSHDSARPSTANLPPIPVTTPGTPSRHRFLPRIFVNALNGRRSGEPSSPKSQHGELLKRQAGSGTNQLLPAPKMEYVKLPGTKGAVLIKAVETAKKSFLAILCGEHGEKVELFAGTYRTTLGLSRTFILPDSPRSLELQLQGDDLVEVFLVFAQNVFGLEPATVRVREVRVGRAERRAARRRAREIRTEDQNNDAMAAPLGDNEATDVNMSVGVTLTTSATSQTFDDTMLTPPPMSRQASDTNLNSRDAGQPTSSTSVNAVQSEELATIAAAQVAPYTTFQQLSFAPQFPLTTIADEYIIPPTYNSFLEYRARYEPESAGSTTSDLANVQFSPPGLPVPLPLPPPMWIYRDPKGVIRGPWKAELMQRWYKEGFLPPDLPVRREEDTEFILLKDLRAQCVDPTHPFHTPPPPMKTNGLQLDEAKPLLNPLSLLTQPKRYGPPALFYTTRGGHSTSIVDARGRSVLRGRLRWTIDDDDNFNVYGGGKLGDVKRLEAFDINSGAIIIAIRRGGLEALDIEDALVNPGDHSRSVLPNYKPSPSVISRRPPFVWKVGSPLSAFATGPVSSEKLVTGLTLGKKYSLGLGGKSPAKSEFALGNADDYEGRQDEELLFLGRVENDIYFCERSNGSFRVLRLCPILPS